MPGDPSLVALLAEEPAAHIAEPLPPLERVVTDRYCVNLGATPDGDRRQPRRFPITADAAHIERSYTLGGRRWSDAEHPPSRFRPERTHDRSWNVSASTICTLHALTDPTTCRDDSVGIEALEAPGDGSD